jgi:hypothetical protein
VWNFFERPDEVVGYVSNQAAGISLTGLSLFGVSIQILEI